MRNRILLVCLFLTCIVQATPASACPDGYRPCGKYCCGGQ
jgi:hypothetical protein